MSSSRRIVAALCLTLLSAAVSGAAQGDLQLWEDSRGAPGVTAPYPPGAGQLADIDLGAGSAEGGGLLQGATEIEMRPTGSVVFVDFSCEFSASCSEGADYLFTPGGAGEGGLVIVSDPDFQEQQGTRHVGTILFDAEEAPGTIELVDCNYTGQDLREYSCAPFTLAALPEPRAGSGIAVGAVLLAGLARRRGKAV